MLRRVCDSVCRGWSWQGADSLILSKPIATWATVAQAAALCASGRVGVGRHGCDTHMSTMHVHVHVHVAQRLRGWGGLRGAVRRIPPPPPSPTCPPHSTPKPPFHPAQPSRVALGTGTRAPVLAAALTLALPPPRLLRGQSRRCTWCCACVVA